MKEEYGVEVTFPVAPCSVVFGFGIILFIEQAVLHSQVWKLSIFVSNVVENRSKLWWLGKFGKSDSR